MSNSRRSSCQHALAWLIAALCLCLLGEEARCANEPSSEALRLAEKKYREAALQEAERLFRSAIETRDGGERRHCFDRLLAIYVRLGRFDLALRVGEHYRRWLRETNDRTRIRELDLQLGEFFLALGQYRQADPCLERALTNDSWTTPLKPHRQIAALLGLARGAEGRGDSARAALHYRRSEELALNLLADKGKRLEARWRIECTWALAECYRYQKRPGLALAPLSALLPVHDQLNDQAGKRDTLRRLARHHADRGDYAESEKQLRRALALHEKLPVHDHLVNGDLLVSLADVMASQNRGDEADTLRGRAVVHYQKALLEPQSKRFEAAGPISALWRLQKLYQNTSQFRKALELTEGPFSRTGGVLLEPKLNSERGWIRIQLGTFAQARSALREAVANLENQSPANLLELAPAAVNLGIAELETGELVRAEERGQQCVEIYTRHRFPDDLILIEAFDLVGTCAAQRGEYALAIERFREGVARCEKLGATADRRQSNLLLNIALLHKSQGDLDEALRTCRRALVVYRRFAEPDALGLAAFDAAQASLLVARGRLEEAFGLTKGILEACKRYEIDGGPMVITARHCQGLYYLSVREFGPAEAAWRELLAIQAKEKQTLLLPRTLNYLGLSAELQKRYEPAEKEYRRAADLQRANPRAFPVTHFISLWRLSLLADRAGRKSEAFRMLKEAVGVVEAARLRTYGDAQQRANYFGQFAPAFDLLVDWSVREGDVESAVAAATRGRSRTLLDQLQLAGVDPLAELTGARGEELRQQEAKLKRQVSAIRARAQFIPIDALEEDPAKKLLDELDQAQQKYSEVWREVLNASPLYRNLSADDPSKTVLTTLRDRLLGPKTMLLVYHLGKERSYALLVGDRSKKPEAFPLLVAADLAERVTPLEQPSDGGRLPSTRSVVIKARPAAEPDKALPAAAPVGNAVPLTQALARALVENYRQQLTAADFRPTRTVRLAPRTPERPVPEQRLDLLGRVLLPAALRARIEKMAPECLLLVPDGPLHKLPFEALLLEAGPKPRFVLDELPPLVYAPSAAVLTLLSERSRDKEAGPLSLLTVGNPAYPKVKVSTEPSPEVRSGARGVLGLRGQLPPLPFTAVESRRIRQHFDPAQVTALEGVRATKAEVVASISRCRVVHIAAHGFADDRFGNLFGALALAPPPQGKETPADDGFLSLLEIYRLPLRKCELTVLSACDTNVGPQRPLEAGVTLAGGFLVAGAHRVVASHWSVDDESTAELMSAFFAEVMASARRNETIHYARALQQARRKVRQRWPAPYHWAPFVLIGPAE